MAVWYWVMEAWYWVMAASFEDWLHLIRTASYFVILVSIMKGCFSRPIFEGIPIVRGRFYTLCGRLGRCERCERCEGTLFDMMVYMKVCFFQLTPDHIFFSLIRMDSEHLLWLSEIEDNWNGLIHQLGVQWTAAFVEGLITNRTKEECLQIMIRKINKETFLQMFDQAWTWRFLELLKYDFLDPVVKKAIQKRIIDWINHRPVQDAETQQNDGATTTLKHPI